MKKIIGIPLALIRIGSLVILAACAKNQLLSPHPTTDSMAPAVIYEAPSTVSLDSYYKLAQYSEVVLLGTVEAQAGVVNTARNPADPAQPDPRFFTIAQVYQVQVEKVFQGQSPKTIYIAQKQGKLLHGKTPAPDEIRSIQAASIGSVYQPLQAGVRYLFFLRSVEFWPDYEAGGITADQIYVRTADPWRFNAQDLENVFVEGETQDLKILFPSQPLSAILAQMGDPSTAKGGGAYPAPAYP